MNLFYDVPRLTANDDSATAEVAVYLANIAMAYDWLHTIMEAQWAQNIIEAVFYQWLTNNAA